MKKTNIDIGFIGVAQFLFTVPNNFSLEVFRKRHANDIHIDKIVIDENFYPSTLLRAGEPKIAVIVQLTQGSILNRCRAFVKSQGGQLPNAQGVAMAWEKNMNEFPKGRWVYALDREENLFKDKVPNNPCVRAAAIMVNEKTSLFNSAGISGQCHNGIIRAGSCILYFKDPE